MGNGILDRRQLHPRHGRVGGFGCRGGSLVIPKEFERSNLALELKAGKKRLELVLHGLTNEQCGMAGLRSRIQSAGLFLT